MYNEEILSRPMIESEVYPECRPYSEAQQGKADPIVHSYLTPVFPGDFRSHWTA